MKGRQPYIAEQKEIDKQEEGVMKEFRGKRVPETEVECNSIGRGTGCNTCVFESLSNCDDFKNNIPEILKDYIKYGDLTKIETEFGLLPEWVQSRLKDVYARGAKIEMWNGRWVSSLVLLWTTTITYRVKPEQPEPEKPEDLKKIIECCDGIMKHIQAIKDLLEGDK